MLKEAMLYRTLEENKVYCYLCNHHCKISDKSFGICGMRENIGGKLFTYAYGEVIAAHVDPIEKKPIFHLLPGSVSFSIATAGCNFKCGFCQNWQISQASKKNNLPDGTAVLPGEIVKLAQANDCQSISYTYTEPTIFFEYSYETAKLAKNEGLFNIFVSNGFMTKEALDAIHPYLDACNVDLKSFSENFYRKICHGRLAPVLDSIGYMKKLGIWIEITTLVIPGENDSDEELGNIAQFISDIDPNIPWHISRFHPDYQFTTHQATSYEVLERAYSIGKQHGLRYIYIGNVLGKSEDTLCQSCKKVLIQRHGFRVINNNLKNGRCGFCQAQVAGIFQ